jgi:3-dehydroquinate synthase
MRPPAVRFDQKNDKRGNLHYKEAMNVTVQLGVRSYDIIIQPGILADLPRWLEQYGLTADKGLLITDDLVDPLYGEPARKRLLDAGKNFPRAVVPAGEASKSQAELFRLYEAALDAGLDRKALVLAIGGGVVGDLAGYAAASYLRGLRFVQIPTTLLAMVDSAVGGKTGINLPRGKNLIGAFHQPSLVLCDLDVLKTLPPREFRAGLAEVIKYGIIVDAEFFAYLAQNLEAALVGSPDVLEHIVARSCQIKAGVVGQDETESGLRAILNFGHTLGHAIEAVAGYGRYLHGEAIAIGMVFAARLSVKLSGLKSGQAKEIEALFQRVGLPVRAPELAWTALRQAMSVDKKSESGLPRFVLAKEIGCVEYGVAIDEVALRDIWSTMV